MQPAPARLRGKLLWDESKCDGCMLCVRDCPARAIEVEVVDRAAKKYVFHYRMDRCIYCAQCVASCKEGALSMSSTLYHLASTDKANVHGGLPRPGHGGMPEEEAAHVSAARGGCRCSSSGHGSPMNAIEDNEFSRGWKEIARELPRPSAILCISAHWETAGVAGDGHGQAADDPRFRRVPAGAVRGAVPRAGQPWLARETIGVVKKVAVGIDREWGLDHGCWSVLRRMYPAADIPVVQLSLDTHQPPRLHYELAPRARAAAGQGRADPCQRQHRAQPRAHHASARAAASTTPFGLPWALEASALFKSLIDAGATTSSSTTARWEARCSWPCPTPEHYLPLLYALALQGQGRVDQLLQRRGGGGVLTMTSLVVQ